jgi:prolyl oligopeptidase
VLVALVLPVFLAACRSEPPADSRVASIAPNEQSRPVFTYPEAPRTAHVDTYHGERVSDPFRPLEQLDAPQTRRWIEAENAISRPYLESTPAHARITARLKELWNYERYGVPEEEGGRYFWLRNDGLQNQSVLYVADRIDATPRVLIDPNQFSADGTVAMADFEVSPDGRKVVYAVSDGGTDWKSWHVVDVDTGRKLPDVVRHTKFTDVTWDRDSQGFYYSRYPADASGKAEGSKQVAIHHHRLGDTQAADRLVYRVTDHATRNPYPTVSDDGRFLVIDLFDGYFVNGIYYIDLEKARAKGGAPGQDDVVRLLDKWDARYEFIGSKGSELFFHTTAQAPRGRIIGIDTAATPARWREIVPESADALEQARYIGGRFVAAYLHDAHGRVRVFDGNGGHVADVPLPGLGKVAGFTGGADDPRMFFSYTDFLQPLTVYRYELASNGLTVFRQPKIAADTSVYMTEQVFYTSKDGTRVPMFITRRREFTRDGSAPLLLYGYGGFNAPQTPAFSSSVLAWLEMGGVYAVANLRGGAEYGEEWHEAGTRLKKQNVFDDFAAAARWLIGQRYTSSERIAAMGRSNGGLLVGAVITQHPDLFAAALPVVGVLDMLRYHTASANARQWSSDYGLSENPEEYRALRAYSPYHNVRDGTCYPPTLITTADHDDRVVPWHSYKFAAAMQAAQGCANPVLIRVETRAGHGAGKPVWMQIEDVANNWAFLARHLGMQDVLTGTRATAGSSH